MNDRLQEFKAACEPQARRANSSNGRARPRFSPKIFCAMRLLPGVGQGRIHMRLKASGVADLHVQVVLYKVKNTGVKIPLDRNS